MAYRRKDSGTAAVEFALVLPFLLLLICGIIDFGRAFNARITLSHAARESVRIFALGGTEDEARTRADDTAVGLTVTGVTFNASPCTFGDPTTVTVTVSFAYLTPFIANLAPSTTSFSDQGVMRCGG